MIDWQRICLNLRRHGSLASHARTIGVRPKILQDLSRGDVREPSFRTCLDLLDLHHDLCPERHRAELIGEP